MAEITAELPHVRDQSSGKSSVGAKFVDAACRRGERALMFVYEESASQLLRNMESIGLRLQRWIDRGLLRIEALADHQHATIWSPPQHHPRVVPVAELNGGEGGLARLRPRQITGGDLLRVGEHRTIRQEC